MSPVMTNVASPLVPAPRAITAKATASTRARVSAAEIGIRAPTASRAIYRMPIARRYGRAPTSESTRARVLALLRTEAHRQADRAIRPIRLLAGGSTMLLDRAR